MKSEYKTDKLAKLLGINLDESHNYDSNDVLNMCIERLEKIPYVPYPLALRTVDIIPYKYINKKISVLLIRKKGQEQYQTIGGFVDPGETSEQAVMRETKEESNLNFDKYFHLLNYLGSFYIPDSRYNNTPHKITTSLYTTVVFEDDCKELKCNDLEESIEEFKWYDIDALEENLQFVIRNNHIPLIKCFLDFTKK